MAQEGITALKLKQLVHSQNELGAPEATITTLIIDSRKAHELSNALFIAIQGKNRDGHDYIGPLYKRGVRNFLVTKAPTSYPDANFFEVPNTVKALQSVVKWHRTKFHYPVIGITGSNGKTIVKEWLFQLLHSKFQIVKSPKSYNSQIGVPLSVWQMDDSYSLGIFEAGISLPQEMEALQEIIQPTIGIFTNIGAPHQQNFDSLGQKTEEKLKLFKEVDTLIYCADHHIIDEKVRDKFDSSKLFSWGIASNAKVKVTPVTNATFHIQCDETNFDITIPFSDAASIENALHCACTLLFLETPIAEIQKKIQEITPVKMRLEQMEGVNGCILLNDAYNSDLKGLEIALSQLSKLGHMNKTVIFSDLVQDVSNDSIFATKTNLLLKQFGISKFIGIGKVISNNQELFEIPNKSFYPNTEAFLDDYFTHHFHQEAILIKGARHFKLERIISKLELKSHQTQLEINLDALRKNLQFYRSKLSPGVKIMVMVKAYGYGSGGPEVARMLTENGVNYLGVANVDEGIEIRKSGVTTPVIVLNPSVEAFAAMIKHDLEPEIFSIKMLQLYNQTIFTEGALKPFYPIHLKIDTGMNRLGIKPEEIPHLLKVIKAAKHIRIESVFSHLAASDNPNEDQFTQQQISLLGEVAKNIQPIVSNKITTHILNSAGIERFPYAQFDMVRLGVGLYGIAQSSTFKKYLLPVASLTSTVIQLKQISPGESIGYGRTFVAQKKMTIGIIPIGYADGLDRRLSNGGGSVYFAGATYPIVGLVCMDLIMVDFTNANISEGDRIEIFGQHISVNQMAKSLNTIPYEILASIPPRVKRVYYKEEV